MSRERESIFMTPGIIWQGLIRLGKLTSPLSWKSSDSSCHRTGKAKFRTYFMKSWSSRYKYITKVGSQTYMIMSRLTHFYLWKNYLFPCLCSVSKPRTTMSTLYRTFLYLSHEWSPISDYKELPWWKILLTSEFFQLIENNVHNVHNYVHNDDVTYCLAIYIV